MTTKYQFEIEIRTFLKEVEENLPGWLKDDKFEKHSIITEMEEHIWDKAEELAGDEDIEAHHIHQAIELMGNPKQIGKEYKKRGTPHVYISKEWWEIYKKVLIIAMLAITAINLVVYLVQIASVPFWDNTGNLFSGLWSSILPIIGVITVIFVALSMEGYLPKDFKDEFEKSKSGYNSDDLDIKFVNINLDGFRSRVSDNTRKERHISKIKRVKPPIKTKELLGEGIWGLIWAFLMIAQPIDSLNQKFTLEFLEFVRLCGVLGLAESIVKLVQVFAGVQRVGTQQLLLIVMIAIQILYIQRYLWAVDIDGVLRIFSTWNFDPTKIFRIILWFSIIGTGIGCLERLGKIGSYQSKLNRYNAYQETFHIAA